MKILVLALALVAFGANAQIKAPTVYGKINKMIRYIDQDDNGYESFTNVEDGARPTRFGIQGSLNTSASKIGYILEVGYNSETNAPGDTYSKSADGIGVRRAVATFDWGFGTFKVGQEWTAASLIFLAYDPMAHMGSSLIGTQLKNDVAGGDSMIGYYSRTRKDQIGYVSPEMAGFQFKVSYDRNDNVTRETSGHEDNGLEALVTYKIDLGSIKADFQGGLMAVHGESQKKDDTLQFGAGLTMGDFRVSGMYTTRSHESNSSVETDTDYMMIAGSYKMGDSTVALSYGGREAGSEKKNMTSVGYMYDINKHVQLNAFASMFKSEGTTDNDATMVGVGTFLQF